MKHTVEDLIAIAHEYFPRGMQRDDPRYEETPEVLRQRAARLPVSARYDAWRAMVKRLEHRYPAAQYPGVHVENNSLFLQDATAGTPWDRCFTGKLWLPVLAAGERRREIEFLVSFVVPYHAIYSIRSYFAPRPDGAPGPNVQRSFDLPAEDVPFARAIAEEIETTFPGHEPLPAEVGLAIVPDVQAGRGWFGEATILGCLFSDSW